MSSGLVNRIIDCSVVDGPGNRTAFFLQGCNFACTYCHNPETIRVCNGCGACVAACPTGAIRMAGQAIAYDAAECVGCDRCISACKRQSSPKATRYTARQAAECAFRNMPFIRGVTASGGECTLQRDFLLELLSRVRAKGLGTLIDSNGSYPFERDPELLGVCDGVLLDVKAACETAHRALTGAGNATVLQNLAFLASEGKLAEVRTVILGGAPANEETVAAVSAQLARLGCGEILYRLIPYRPFGVRQPFYGTLAAPTQEELAALRRCAERSGLQNVLLA